MIVSNVVVGSQTTLAFFACSLYGALETMSDTVGGSQMLIFPSKTTNITPSMFASPQIQTLAVACPSRG